MRTVAFLMMALSLVLFAGTVLRHASAQSSDDNLWYFGKGVEKNMFLTYRIVDNTKTIVPPGSFNMTIYFQQYDNNTKSWIVPVFVVLSNGTMINGTFGFNNRTDLPFFPSTGSVIPTILEPYESEYIRVIEGLAPFASWPSSLNDKQWGSLAQSLGMAGLNGTKIITVPAGTFNCTEIIHAYNADYVNKDLPYPVEGSEAGGWYELVAMGYGQPTFLQTVQQNTIMVSPLEQFKAGVPANDIKCSSDMRLVIKTEDGSPACVTHTAAEILAARGWGHLP